MNFSLVFNREVRLDPTETRFVLNYNNQSRYICPACFFKALEPQEYLSESEVQKCQDSTYTPSTTRNINDPRHPID